MVGIIIFVLVAYVVLDLLGAVGIIARGLFGSSNYPTPVATHESEPMTDADWRELNSLKL